MARTSRRSPLIPVAAAGSVSPTGRPTAAGSRISSATGATRRNAKSPHSSKRTARIVHRAQPDCGDFNGSWISPGAWSPDGTLIAASDLYLNRIFTVRPDGTDYTVDSSGTGIRCRLATPTRRTRRSPATSGPRPRRHCACRSCRRQQPCTGTESHARTAPCVRLVQPGPARVDLSDRGRGRREPHALAVGGLRPPRRGARRVGAPNDADVFIRFSLTNVMRAADLSEYTGELRRS